MVVRWWRLGEEGAVVDSLVGGGYRNAWVPKPNKPTTTKLQDCFGQNKHLYIATAFMIAPAIFAGSRRRACRVFPGARGIQGDRDTDMLGQVERDERWRTRTEGRVASS